MESDGKHHSPSQIREKYKSVTTTTTTSINMDLVPSVGGHEDGMIDTVLYCGVNNVISILGILGNLLLLVIFLHPRLIVHKCLFHSYLKAIALADLLYLIYSMLFNCLVCLGYTDPPVEVSSLALAQMLKVVVTHPQVLTAASDFLVCLLTLNRLRVILTVREKRTSRANRPEPITLQVLAVYMLSLVLDSPNWFMFIIENCDNHTEINQTECWSYVENSRYFTDEKTAYKVIVILQCIFIKVIPALGIIVMNIIIVYKVGNILSL